MDKRIDPNGLTEIRQNKDERGSTTVFLHRRGKHHDKLWLLGAAMMTVIAILTWMEEDVSAYDFVKGIFFLFVAVVYSWLGLHGLKGARIDIGTQFIVYQAGIFSQKIVVDWQDIREIRYGPFMIQYHLTDGNVIHNKFKTSFAENSKLAKDVIWEMAESKGILVVGG